MPATTLRAYRLSLLVIPKQRVTADDLLGYACIAVDDVLSADKVVMPPYMVSLAVRFLADSDEQAQEIADRARQSVMHNALSGDPVVVRRGRISRSERTMLNRPAQPEPQRRLKTASA